MRVRLEIVGAADEAGFVFPLRQQDVADCLGLTGVHVNRVIRQLREKGLATFQFGRVRILNLPELEAFCGFDPAYLYLDRVDR